LLDQLNAGIQIETCRLKIGSAFYQFIGVRPVLDRQRFQDATEISGRSLIIFHLLLPR